MEHDNKSPQVRTIKITDYLCPICKRHVLFRHGGSPWCPIHGGVKPIKVIRKLQIGVDDEGN